MCLWMTATLSANDRAQSWLTSGRSIRPCPIAEVAMVARICGRRNSSLCGDYRYRQQSTLLKSNGVFCVTEPGIDIYGALVIVARL
jgi:hypothetical protein